ncbi:unnamed protein product, partial [Didymodactylos carnosus]
FLILFIHSIYCHGKLNDEQHIYLSENYLSKFHPNLPYHIAVQNSLNTSMDKNDNHYQEQLFSGRDDDHDQMKRANFWKKRANFWKKRANFWKRNNE